MLRILEWCCTRLIGFAGKEMVNPVLLKIKSHTVPMTINIPSKQYLSDIPLLSCHPFIKHAHANHFTNKEWLEIYSFMALDDHLDGFMVHTQCFRNFCVNEWNKQCKN